MEIIGTDEKNEIIICKMTNEEFCQFAGFRDRYSYKNQGNKYTPGTIVDVGQCYEDAQEALDLHKKALSAANTLKAASTRFLSFFKVEEPTKK